MRRHLFAFGAIAVMALTAVAFSGLKASRQALSAGEPPTMSIERMHRQVDAASLPQIHVAEPY
ncbi:MAG TPA: hypothetical protein VEK73_12740 [Xanthobacteraceae bacterium]|nr:hypothetical protein [Xanthobacteraceae bacterium]